MRLTKRGGAAVVMAVGLGLAAQGASAQGGANPPATQAPAAAAAADAKSTETVARQILDLRRKIREAVLRKDRAALESYYHDRFNHIRENGRTDLKKERIDLLLAGQNGVELASDDQALIETYGPDTAVLSGVSVIRDKEAKKSDTYQWLTLYVRDKGKWLVALSQANRVPKP